MRSRRALPEPGWVWASLSIQGGEFWSSPSTRKAVWGLQGELPGLWASVGLREKPSAPISSFPRAQPCGQCSDRSRVPALLHLPYWRAQREPDPAALAGSSMWTCCGAETAYRPAKALALGLRAHT